MLNKSSIISVIGLGYVGLPPFVIANRGYTVIGVDTNDKVVTSLGGNTLIEPDLDLTLKNTIKVINSVSSEPQPSMFLLFLFPFKKISSRPKIFRKAVQICSSNFTK